MPDLTLALANRIIDGAFSTAQRLGLPPLAVVVLDAAGHLKAAQRQDGASMFRIDIAIGKAWAAVGMGQSSAKLAAAASGNPNFFVTLAATAQGRFLPQPGAVLIRDAGGGLLGAVGASGAKGEEDEAACLHGVLAAGLKSDPVE